jgi:hypothetical protein
VFAQLGQELRAALHRHVGPEPLRQRGDRRFAVDHDQRGRSDIGQLRAEHRPVLVHGQPE